MDDFPNQLRKQFPIDRVLENPGLVVTLYENERDHAADIIEDQQKRIEKLEAALDELLTYQVASEAAARNVGELARVMQKHRAALGEKKDG